MSLSYSLTLDTDLIVHRLLVPVTCESICIGIVLDRLMLSEQFLFPFRILILFLFL